MSEILKLAERCEAASGANYALEREIAEAVGHPSAKASGFQMQYEGVRLPSYTASLDAAMTLVPEGCDVTLDVEKGRGGAIVFDDLGVEGIGRSSAATPALALCAASLRARSAQP